MKIQILELIEGAKRAEGLTVIIDVFRAFTTECYAFDRGAALCYPVGELEDAFALKREDPARILLGERGLGRQALHLLVQETVQLFVGETGLFVRIAERDVPVAFDILGNETTGGEEVLAEARGNPGYFGREAQRCHLVPHIFQGLLEGISLQNASVIRPEGLC